MRVVDVVDGKFFMARDWRAPRSGETSCSCTHSPLGTTCSRGQSRSPTTMVTTASRATCTCTRGDVSPAQCRGEGAAHPDSTVHVRLVGPDGPVVTQIGLFGYAEHPYTRSTSGRYD